MSFVEAIANVGVGYILAVLTQVIVFPLFDIRTSLSDSLIIGMFFTAVSIVRSYALRRLFETTKVRARQTQTDAQPGAAAMRTSEFD